MCTRFVTVLRKYAKNVKEMIDDHILYGNFMTIKLYKVTISLPSKQTHFYSIIKNAYSFLLQLFTHNRKNSNNLLLWWYLGRHRLLVT